MERRPWVFAGPPSRCRLGSYGAVSQRIALLANLATVEDQVRAKELELAAAGLQGVGVSKEQRDAILNATRAQAEMSRVQDQASIGVFSFKDANKAAADTLRMWQSQGLLDPANLKHFASASNLAAKSVEALADQAKVAGSSLPMFQQALNDAGNARKQLDSLMVEGMNVNRGFFVEFGQQLRSGASAWEAFKESGLNALSKIADKLMQMAADNLFASAFGGSSGGAGGLAGILGGLFGGGGSGSVPVMSSGLGAGTGGLSFPMFANGGTLSRGWGVVGERGPELINVHKGGVTIVPNHVSKPFLPGFADGGTMSPNGMVSRLAAAGGSGGPPVVMNDNRQISIGEGASAETVTQLREELARDRAARYSDTVRIVQSAKKRRDL